jgi:hypothetical protein
MQSMHITTNVVSSIPFRRGVLNTTLCDGLSVTYHSSVVFSANKTDRHNITRILLNVALSSITHPTFHFTSNTDIFLENVDKKYQRSYQNPKIEGQITQWSKEKG